MIRAEHASSLPDRGANTDGLDPRRPESVACWSMEVASHRVIGNAQLALFFGVPDEAVAGGPLGVFLAAIHPLDVVRVVAAIEAAITSGHPYRVTYRVRGRDRQRTVLAQGRVERDEAGHAVRILGEVTDVGG